MLCTSLVIVLLVAILVLKNLGKTLNLVVLDRLCPNCLVNVSHVRLEQQAISMLVQDVVAFSHDLALLGSTQSYLFAGGFLRSLDDSMVILG